MRFGLLMTKLKMDANDVEVRDSAKIARLHRSDYSAYRVISLLNCGFTSGLLQAAVFNPWDRALYLSVLHHRRFLHHDNFQEPMRGVLQTIVQKAISGGLYFPLEEIFSSCIHDYLDGGTYPLPVHGSGSISKYSSIFLGGMMAGAVNGLVLNPFSRIKFYTWGKAPCGEENFYSTAKEMYRRGGFLRFFVGSGATVSRDLLFGGVFAYFRHHFHTIHCNNGSRFDFSTKTLEFTVNMLSASIATILSSPLNYIRNIHYATPPDSAPQTAHTIMKDLFTSAFREPTALEQFLYLQSRLRIGWGTARVGCGMAFSASLYKLCSDCYT